MEDELRRYENTGLTILSYVYLSIIWEAVARYCAKEAICDGVVAGGPWASLPAHMSLTKLGRVLLPKCDRTNLLRHLSLKKVHRNARRLQFPRAAVVVPPHTLLRPGDS